MNSNWICECTGELIDLSKMEFIELDEEIKLYQSNRKEYELRKIYELNYPILIKLYIHYLSTKDSSFEEYFYSVECPDCLSHDCILVKHNIFLDILKNLYTLTFPNRTYFFKCRACERKWYRTIKI